MSSPKEVGAERAPLLTHFDAVDTKANTVTLMGAEGNKKTITVKNPELQQRIKNLKAGDEVDVTYTEALALAIMPAIK